VGVRGVVNEESYKFAATGKAEYPMVAPEGGKEPLRAEYSAFTMGSDHDVYQDSSFGIPAIYLNDWPDRYIHTNFDMAANIDPTKLKRAAFIGAASGYFLAGLTARSESQMALNSEMRAVRLSAQMTGRILHVEPAEQQTLNGIFTNYIAGADESLQAFWGLRKQLHLRLRRHRTPRTFPKCNSSGVRLRRAAGGVWV